MFKFVLKLVLLLILVVLLVYLNKASAGWSGSGYFINNQGYIATANHVVSGSTVLKVRYKNTYYIATVIGQSRLGDTAIVHIPVMFTSGLSLKTTQVPGSLVFVLGYPLPNKLGTDLKISSGIVIDKLQRSDRIPLKCWSAPGNSGGAVVDDTDTVIGTLTEGDGGENGGLYSYARPVSYVVRLAQDAGVDINVVSVGSSHYSKSQILDRNEDVVVFIINETR